MAALALMGGTSAAERVSPGGVGNRVSASSAPLATLRSDDSARAAAAQPDGKLVAAGTSNGDLALARYQPDGSLDPSFGDGGLVTTDLGGDDVADAVAVQPDGKVVVAGSSGDRSAMVRYLPDGSLDPSFGEGGKVLDASCCLTSVAVQPDGKIVAAGGSPTGGFVVRYQPDGSLDPSFGDGGRAALQGPASALTVEASGDILVAGSADGGAAVVRLTPDGSLDPSFGSAGVASGDGDAGSAANAMATGPDGQVVVAGPTGLASYGPDGSPDASFATVASAGPAATAIALEPDGTIVTAGAGDAGFRLTGVASDGSPAASFGEAGEVTTPIGRDASVSSLLAGPPNGGVLAAGTADADFALARYDADGSLDDSFGDGGVVTTNFSTAQPGAAVAPQATAPERLRAAAAPRRKHHPQHHHHVPPAPNPVPAWYINASNTTELERFAAADACSFAKTQPPKANRMLILDFGGARAYPSGGFGAAVNHSSIRATNEQIGAALRVAADAYAACHRQGQAKIVYANNNHFERKSSSQMAHKIGLRQGVTVRRLWDYQRDKGYFPAERAGTAGDIETGYWGVQRSKQLAAGAEAGWENGYLDFGTAGGCPPHPPHSGLHGCFNGWTLADVAHVSNSGGAEPLPEVYYRGGHLHFDQAGQWANVARTWNSQHATPYSFFGATGSTEFSGLSPGESWHRLRSKVPGHVGRELLNYKEDQWTSKPAARGDDPRR